MKKSERLINDTLVMLSELETDNIKGMLWRCFATELMYYADPEDVIETLEMMEENSDIVTKEFSRAQDAWMDFRREVRKVLNEI